MSRCLVSALLLLTFISPAICAKKPVKVLTKDPTAEFFSAITKGNASRVKSLVAANPKLLNAKSSDGKTGVQLAVAASRPDTVRVLVKLGASVNSKDKNGLPLLALAVNSVNKEMTVTLLELGARPDAILPDGSSLLHLAVSSGSADIVQQLIVGGAQINAADKQGQTPLKLALVQSKPDIVALLRKSGALDQPPQLNIDISGRYQEPRISADKSSKELAKWIMRAEFKNVDGHRWRFVPNMAIFHSSGKKTFSPILTFPYQPNETLALYQKMVILWPWEDFLQQTASRDLNGRGETNSPILDFDPDIVVDDEGYADDQGSAILDAIGLGKPPPPETDLSFACTLTVDGKAGVWAESTVETGQSLIAEWESITLASPEELKRVGIAENAEHDLILVGPIVYDPDDPGAGAFLVTSLITRLISSTPEKFAKVEIVQLTSKYVKEQIDNGPTDCWRALFVTLLWKQPRPIHNADDLLIQTLQQHEKCGPLAGATAGVSLEERKCAAAADTLVSIASDAKANEKIRNRIITGLYTFDSPAVRDCLAAVAADKPQPWIVRLNALESLAKCPQCDWAIIERIAQDKTLLLQDKAKTLLEQHKKNSPDK
ncbi:MAG: ankyrin repeat domain-containing protein [Armatimonadetes bacterium]|nr:ankyrin repeat domain-containing protein [Armatimonadota bacterium]